MTSSFVTCRPRLVEQVGDEAACGDACVGMQYLTLNSLMS